MTSDFIASDAIADAPATFLPLQPRPIDAPAAEPRSAPLRQRLARVALRAGGAGAVAVAVAALHSAHDPGVICPLRLLTGVPCPVCGSTTVFIELGRGHALAAVLANPFTAVAGAGLLLSPLLAPLGIRRRWRELPKPTRVAAVVLAVALSWAWQLHRLGFAAPLLTVVPHH